MDFYGFSVAFGMRKALMSEQGKLDMEEDIETLKTEKMDLEKQVSYMYIHCHACVLHVLYVGNGSEE